MHVRALRAPSFSFGPMYHQMLSAVVLSQSTVSLSRAAKPSVSHLESGTEDRKLVCGRGSCRQPPRGDSLLVATASS